MTSHDALHPETKKWAIVLGFVVVAGAAVLLEPIAEDPLQPGLLVLLWALWLKLFLEYGWRLPMRFLAYVQLQPSERTARNCVMIAMTLTVVGVTAWVYWR